MKIIKPAVITLIVIALLVGGLLLKTFYDAGEFKTINPHFSASCRSIPGVFSSEDITIDQETGMAFISSADRRTRWSGTGRPRQGAIFGLDLKTQNPQLVNLTVDFSKEFNPHGIGLWVGKDGKRSLFVVNHRKDGHFVEVFDLKDNKLVHRNSVSGALMHSPNDVIPTGPESFYVTNDHGNTSGPGRAVEEYLQLARATVLYYDGREFRTVAAASPMPTGST